MLRFRKSICMLLAVCVLLAVMLIPQKTAVEYSEDVFAMRYLEDTGAAEPETVPAQPQELPEEQPDELTGILVAEEIPEPAETEPEEITLSAPETEAKPLSTPEESSLLSSNKPQSTKTEELEEPKGHNGIPLYFQTDYPNNVYGVGTIANNGCSATCLAMVATYMTGHEYLPDEIARYFGGAAENNIARLEHGSEEMQLPYKKAKNWHETLAAIQDGKIAIILMGPTSLFTDSQHFILVTGTNEDGKLMVNDPLRSNYDKWNIKRGLREGFEENDLLMGYSGAWIYDKSAMPEEPFLYSEPLPVRGEPRYDFQLTWEEMQLIAKVVWVEARGECNEGQQAVAEVVLNRLASDKFPDNLRDVIYGENQFRSAEFLKDAQPYQLQYEMIENALYGPYVLPEDVFYFATTAKTNKVWGQIGGHIFCYAED